ncbi:MAG: hypothetical protein QOI53_943 [Verrucomicrobiota bacterium]|nr:hypothetical protein [Verrucomicrobiota bacterium]
MWLNRPPPRRRSSFSIIFRVPGRHSRIHPQSGKPKDDDDNEAQFFRSDGKRVAKLQNQLSLRGKQLGFKLGEFCFLLGKQFLSQCQCQAQEYLAFGKLIQ